MFENYTYLFYITLSLNDYINEMLPGGSIRQRERITTIVKLLSFNFFPCVTHRRQTRRKSWKSYCLIFISSGHNMPLKINCYFYFLCNEANSDLNFISVYYAVLSQVQSGYNCCKRNIVFHIISNVRSQMSWVVISQFLVIRNWLGSLLG